MTKLFSYQTAALLAGVSAFLYLLVIAFSGGGAMIPLLVAAIVIALFALGLYRSMRWLAYLAFIGLIVSMIVSFAQSYGADAFLPWLYGLNAVANLVAVIILFVLLWRPKTAIA